MSGYVRTACVLVAVAVVLHLTADPPLNPKVDATSAVYDLEDVFAPRVAGVALLILQKVLMIPILGDVIMAHMFRENQLNLPRSLAAKIDHMPMHYPHYAGDTSYHTTLDAQDENGELLREWLREDGFTYSENDVAALKAKVADKQFHFWSVRDYAIAYRSGLTTPLKVVERLLAAMEESDKLSPPLRAFTQKNVEDLRAQAVASGERIARGASLSIFDGVPVAVKQEMDVIGYYTTLGTKFLGELKGKATSDAPPVAKLRALGAVIVGGANMHEIGIGPTGHNSHFQSARNPYNLQRYTGGSSSGSAASVMSGMVPVAIAADGGGSIRIPAALCGGYGLKATWSRIEARGDIAWSVGHTGPITNNLQDTILTYLAIGGNSKLPQPPIHLAGLDRINDLSDVRIGIYQEHYNHASAEVIKRCNDALDGLLARGAVKVDVTVPNLNAMAKSHAIFILSEMVQPMERYMADHFDDFALETKINLHLSKKFTARDITASQRVRAYAMDYFEKLFNEIDVFITPTTPITAPPLLEDAVEVGESNLPQSTALIRFTFLGNLLGFPAISVPVGYDSQGLPVSLQIMAKTWDEHVILRVAQAIESFAPQLAKPAVAFSPLSETSQ